MGVYTWYGLVGVDEQRNKTAPQARTPDREKTAGWAAGLLAAFESHLKDNIDTAEHCR
jgi:hypothetical protein